MSYLVLPLNRFDSEGWFSSDQVIFLTVFHVFLLKKHAAFKWKDAISDFPLSPGSAEALVSWGGKIKYLLSGDFLGNICSKICCNRTVYVNIIASQRWDVFETQCIKLYMVDNAVERWRALVCCQVFAGCSYDAASSCGGWHPARSVAHSSWYNTSPVHRANDEVPERNVCIARYDVCDTHL